MVYCFDLDGTLCTIVKDGDYSKAKPLKDRICIVNRLYSEGHTIIIDTARGSVTKKDWRYTTEQQLREWCVQYHTLYVGTKVASDVYIDDKGISASLYFNDKRN